MSARFTDAEGAEIDAVLAGLTRSEWLRRAGLAMMRQAHAAVRAQLAAEPYSPEELQALRDKIAAEDAAHTDDPEPEECKHKGLRLTKGVCPDCQQYVASKP